MFSLTLRTISIIVLLILAGCVTRSGIAEFQIYKKTFDESTSISVALIDRLASAERAVGRFGTFQPNRLGIDPIFNPNDAVYYSKNGDPPLTAEYRRALTTINRYNELMLAYATGKGFDDILVRAQLLVNETAALGGAITGTTFTLTTFTAVAGKIAKLALAERSRAVFQQEFKDTLPVILNLIKEMRDKTPTMFKNLTFFTNRDLKFVVSGIEKGNAAKLRQQHMDTRILLSNWVLLLTKYQNTLKTTQSAIDNPRLGLLLSGATESIIELRTTISSIRQDLARTR